MVFLNLCSLIFVHIPVVSFLLAYKNKFVICFKRDCVHHVLMTDRLNMFLSVPSRVYSLVSSLFFL